MYTGMAPGVEIVSYGFEQEGGLHEGFLYSDPGDLEADYVEAISLYGADISNNSIGTNTASNGYPCEWEGNYGVTGALIDAIVRGSLGAPFRIVWANGNERETQRCLGIEGWEVPYHSTAPPACAKNHITVGGLNSDDDSVTTFTSFGPSDDNRMKPDVSGPGCQTDDDSGVTSCSSDGDTSYTVMCGTSMSSPTVCGLAALLLQDYRALYPDTSDPRNSTLKVLFAHTAVDLFKSGPDNQTGYGSVRIQPAVDLLRSGSHMEATVSHEGLHSILVVVDAGEPELKATLAWDDPPGTPNVMPVLVNDLDLVVYDPTGARQFPWTLSSETPSGAAARNQPNRVDNIEQVYVESPMAGAWRVDVYGYNVPVGPQVFSLCTTPSLINCSTMSVVSLDRVKYFCQSTATVQVVDCDLNTDDGEIETVTIQVDSTGAYEPSELADLRVADVRELHAMWVGGEGGQGSGMRDQG